MNKANIGFALLACLLCNIAAAQSGPPAIPGPRPYDYKDQVISIEDIKAPLKLSRLGVLAIIVPANSAEQWVATIANDANGSLRTLSPVEFKHISDQGKYDFMEWQTNPFPYGRPTLTTAELDTFRKQQKISITEMRVNNKLAAGNRRALYFGALRGGDVTIFLSNKATKQPNTSAVEVSVIAESPRSSGASRGREIPLSEADQGKSPVAVTYGDTIVVTLPGSAFDEWEDIDEKTGLHLARMRSGEAGYVVFRLSVTGTGTTPLVLKQKAAQGKAYKFEFRFMPGIAG